MCVCDKYRASKGVGNVGRALRILLCIPSDGGRATEDKTKLKQILQIKSEKEWGGEKGGHGIQDPLAIIRFRIF
jgi:hypothetical protein